MRGGKGSSEVEERREEVSEVEERKKVSEQGKKEVSRGGKERSEVEERREEVSRGGEGGSE